MDRDGFKDPLCFFGYGFMRRERQNSTYMSEGKAGLSLMTCVLFFIFAIEDAYADLPPRCRSGFPPAD